MNIIGHMLNIKKTNNLKGDNMKKCQICNDKPNEIFIGFLAKQGLKICKPCMSKHGDSHVIIDGEDNFIPTDYFNLIDNNNLNSNINIIFFISDSVCKWFAKKSQKLNYKFL